MSIESTLEKNYNPRDVEPEIYKRWEDDKAFESEPDDRPHAETFTVVIPPPNVTGALHLGHALNNTLQDILVRYHRMRGFNTLWQPGTDHAGIATQAVVERRLREEEGKTRHELGREELVRRIWQWKDDYEKRILNQLRMMGCSCDWSRRRFTLDEGMSQAVRQMFFKLFKDGLIFRGKRLVNWDTQLQTAVSDDEVYYETTKGHFWHFKYPVIPTEPRASARENSQVINEPSDSACEDAAASSGEGNLRRPGEPAFVVIATTRPETMLGDTAVAVHPDPEAFFDKQEAKLSETLGELTGRSSGDATREQTELTAKLEALRERRASHLPGLIQLRDMARDGRKLMLPLVERVIPLVTDEWANPMLGSGCVKITPAHDPNDYEVGLRHSLPMLNVLAPEGKIARIVEADGSVNPHSANYEGLRFTSDGRDKVVSDLEALGLVENIEDRDIEISYSDRSKLRIEPYLSDQWFIRTVDLPEPQASACAMHPDHAEPQASACATPRPPSTPRTNPDLSHGATLLTWTTYGTWLPGDKRGSVSRAPRGDGHQELRNLPGEPYDDDDPARHTSASHRIAGESVWLSEAHADTVLTSIAETCERHAIEPLVVAIMANHVHVLCQGEQYGGEFLQLFKGNASHQLGRSFQLKAAPRWWTKSGSRRRIRGGSDLTAAIEYVKEQQSPLRLWSFDDSAGLVAGMFDQARATVAAERRAKTGSGDSHGEIAQAEACGSGLAQAAMDAVTDGRIQVFPARYGKSYLDWLGEKRDWCISRQLWWGHRIPVWSALLGEVVPGATSSERWSVAARLGDRFFELPSVHAETILRHANVSVVDERSLICVLGEPTADEEAELRRCGYTQDPDVLDTWFSSALWPFSTLGWPEKTPHLKQHYPGSVLCTGRDIITNWVARMVMFGLYAMGDIPFDHVYIHPKILDGRGETMSKSKGNGVDPVDVIHTHGADALRYSMADMTTETQDIRMPVEYVCPHCGKLTDQTLAIKTETQRRKSRGEKLDRKLQPADCTRIQCTHKECGKEFATQWANEAVKQELPLGRETSDKFDIGRNFCNKLWNAARFALMNLEGAPCERLDVAALPPEDRWILAKLSQTIRRYHGCIKCYQFSASVRELRDFFWESLCDWYIELTKPRLFADRPASAVGTDSAQQVLAFCMDQVLRLWHPTIPFITEHLWGQLNTVAPSRGLPGIADLRTDTALITAAFPPVEGYPALDDADMLEVFGGLQDVVRGVRDLRVKCDVPPKQAVNATVALPASECDAFKAQAHVVLRMANVSDLTVDPRATRPVNAGSLTLGSMRLFVHDISDDAAEKKRASKQLETLAKQIAGKESKLSNEKFVANARPEVVSAERERLAEMIAQRTTLETHVAELGG